MKYIVISLFVFLLIGCHPTYSLRDTNNAAKVRFVVEDSDRKIEPVSVYIHSDNMCSGTQKVKDFRSFIPSPGGISKKNSDINMAKDMSIKYDSERYVEILVDSYKRLHFSLVGATFRKQCHLTLSFQPVKDQEYEIRYKNEANHCRVLVDQIEVENDTFSYRPEGSVIKQKSPCKKFIN